jgi:hypothetical protein
MRRADGDAVVPPVLLELGWSAKGQPAPGVWRGKRGARTTGDPRFGLPYGQDRAVVLELAREGRRCGASFGGNLATIWDAFGLRERLATTRARLYRVAHCWYERPERAGMALCRRYGFVERLEVCGETGDYAVTLSAEFMGELVAGAPVSMAVVRALARKPGTLDLYLWEAGQIARGAAASVRMWGEGGPCALLRCSGARSRAEQEMRRHQALIQAVWPECPYEISVDGKGLVYRPDRGERHSDAGGAEQRGA